MAFDSDLEQGRESNLLVHSDHLAFTLPTLCFGAYVIAITARRDRRHGKESRTSTRSREGLDAASSTPNMSHD
jgi:hypothetical protein